MKAIRLIFAVLFIVLFLPQYAVNEQQEDSIRELLVIIEDGYQKVDLYLQLSQTFKKTNIDSAIYYANESKELAEQQGDAAGVAHALFNLGKINLRRDSVVRARNYFNDAMRYVKECSTCDSLEASINLFRGKSYTFQDNYAEAIIYFLESIHVAEELKSEELLSDLYDDIGLVLLFLQDYEQALQYFNQALVINRVRGNKKNLANNLRNIGFIYQMTMEYDAAAEQFTEALRIYEELNYYPGIAITMNGLGNIEFADGDYEGALSYYKEALAIAKKIGINYKSSGPFIRALAYNRLGETYMKMGRYPEAIEVLRMSSDIAEENGMPGRKADASKFLSQVYERMGNIILAYDYFKSYNKLSDSIINARNVSMITKLEMEYQYLKRQKERELEQMRRESEQKRREMRLKFLIGLAVVLLILFIIIFILYRKNQVNKARQQELIKKNLELEKDNLERELAFKNKELTTSVMYQLKKNNFIWKISEKLKSIALNLTAENRKSVKAIIKEMEGNMSKESWEEFEFRFNEVHNDFYDNLLRDFPDLTPNELKLCAFLKLNMTTKDIATITYQSTHSITVARYRLRNKLKLERDDNLVSFLSKY
jgi:tetratricopeptide (TPR) repeat protein